MKMRMAWLMVLLTVPTVLGAMPTKDELSRASSVIQELMQPALDELKAGTKTRKEVAEAALELANEAQTKAAKLLLLRGAFTHLVKDGAYEDAAMTLDAMREAVPDLTPQYLVSVLEGSLRNVPKDAGAGLYRALNDAKAKSRYQEELRPLLAQAKKAPTDRALQVQLAEHYAVLEDWPKALDAFERGNVRKAAAAAKAEKDPSSGKRSVVADFWWDYPPTDRPELVQAFRQHAAALYAEALKANEISGLLKARTEKRVADMTEPRAAVAKTLPPKPTAEKKAPPEPASVRSVALAKYCVIDLSAGPDAASYPVTYLAAEPRGGFNVDEYKTTKLVLKRIEAGSFIMGENQTDKSHKVTLTKPFYMGLFEVTQKQWALVTGTNPSRGKGTGDAHPVYSVSYDMIRGSSEGAKWPESAKVDEASFLGKLQMRTKVDLDLPTEAQWEYACRAGTTTTYYWGSIMDDDHAWYNSNSEGVTHPVGSKTPNAWGLYDVIGNIMEMNLDWQNGAPVYGTDPRGAVSGAKRVIRGGCWARPPSSSTAFDRRNIDPPATSNSCGFRLVCPVGR